MTSMMTARRGVMAKPTFSLSSISGLQADYDPRLIVGLVNADPIPSCPDGSGNSRTAAQATGSKRPTYRTSIFNGQPSMRFDGVDDYLSYDNGSVFYTGTAASFFVVAKPIVVTNNARSLVLWDGTGTADFTAPNAPIGTYGTTNMGDFRTSQLSTVPQPSAGTPFVFSDVYGGTSQQTWLNGTAGTGPIAHSAAFSWREFFIGTGVQTSTPSSFQNSDIGRILIYNRALTSTERRQIEAYLGALYGVTVV